FSEVEIIFAQMQSRGIDPTVVSYNILLQSFFWREKLQDALDVWEKMQIKNIQPDETTRQSLMTIYLGQKNLTAAENLFKGEDYTIYLTTQDNLEGLDFHGGLSAARACIMTSFYLKTKLRSQSKMAPFVIVTGIGMHSEKDELFMMRTK